MQVKIQFRDFPSLVSVDDMKNGVAIKQMGYDIKVQEIRPQDGAAGGIIFGTFVLTILGEVAKEIAIGALAEIVIETVKHFTKKIRLQVTTKENPTPKKVELSINMTAEELNKFLSEHQINPEDIAKTVIVSPAN